MKAIMLHISKATKLHLLYFRQMSEDIYHMERQLAELKKQQESSQDSAVSGH